MMAIGNAFPNTDFFPVDVPVDDDDDDDDGFADDDDEDDEDDEVSWLGRRAIALANSVEVCLCFIM